MREIIKIKNYPSFKEEQKLWQRGYEFVAGLDEAGRGPLAGPVVAAAVIFCHPALDAGSRKKNWIPAFAGMTKKGIRDSKKLSAKQRDKWYKVLISHPDIKWGIGVVSEKIIDKINILAATKLAMKRAFKNLEEKFRREVSPRETSRQFQIDYLLLDGNFILDDLSINQKSFIRGDEKIISCAAASIIAKVTRDRMMIKYHKKFPQYGFDRHKGYGTKEHFRKIKNHGPCRIHRKSFAPFA